MAHLRSFPKGTASGPSGLSAQHLLDAIFPGEVTVINALTRSVVQLLVAGLVPPDVMPFIAGANLTALTKKNGDMSRKNCTGRKLYSPEQFSQPILYRAVQFCLRKLYRACQSVPGSD